MRMSRTRLGKTMVGIGCLGIVASIASIVVGQAMVGQVESSVDDSLVLTDEALHAVSDSITLTNAIVGNIQAGVGSVAATLSTVKDSVDQTSTAIADSNAFIGSSLPDALDAVGSVLPTIESVASSVDSALRALSRAPFGPNYDPDKPFDEAIADLSTAIDPLPGQLRQLSTDFDGLETSSADISSGLADLAVTVVELDKQLTEVSVLVDRYSSTTTNALRLAATSRGDLHASARETRILLVVLGLVFALGQVVPIWLGITLITEAGTAHSIIVRKPAD